MLITKVEIIYKCPACRQKHTDVINSFPTHVRCPTSGERFDVIRKIDKRIGYVYSVKNPTKILLPILATIGYLIVVCILIALFILLY